MDRFLIVPNNPAPKQPENAAAPSDPAAMLRRAEQLEQAGRLGEAEQLYRQLVLLIPDHAALLHNLGLLVHERGNPIEAEELLRKALLLEPDAASLHNSLGAILQAQNRLQDAEESYRRAFELQSDYAEALYNLGVVQESLGRFEEALASYRSAVALQPRYARALTRIGALLSQRGAQQEALLQLDSATAASPQFFDAQYYRGTVLSGLGRHEEALQALKRASSLRPDSLDATLATANTLRNAGRYDEALAAYWKAMEQQPARSATHEELNRLAWSSGRHDKYLRSFEYARLRVGNDPELLQLEAAFRMRREDYARAEDLLWQARAHAPQRGDILGLLARSLAGQNRFEEAYPLFVDAIAAEPQVMLHRHQLGYTLLRDRQPEQALQVLQQALQFEPANQLVLAGMSLAYRELGDSRYQELVDLARYVRVYDIKPPSGFADARAFNEALAAELDGLHTTRVEPIDQTLRGGTQTAGALFDAKAPLIQELRAAIRDAVADYVRGLPENPLHPMSLRRHPQFDFIGSWSCRLRSQGYHTNHVHPMGWISSAYYVRLPDDIQTADQRHGWLKFGESGLALGQIDRPDSYVKPEVGRLVLFPSFYWHGTEPFTDSGDRLTIAFDVAPEAELAAMRNSAVKA